MSGRGCTPADLWHDFVPQVGQSLLVSIIRSYAANDPVSVRRHLSGE